MFRRILLKELAEREFTVEQLAEYINVHKNTLSNWLRRKTEPSLSTALSVLKRLGYTAKLFDADETCIGYF